MPDFDMRDIKLELATMLRPSTAGQLTMAFSGAKLNADINSTGACHIGGIDICNSLFKTDRKIQRAVENSSQSALNGALVQTILTQALTGFLHQQNVQGKVVSVTVVGDDLDIVTVD
jgi:hypothetical protein